jgi:hypothetical protein
MGKFKRFFIVYREGLEKKWWHRLANVLIYGSTIFIFILSCCIGFFHLDQNFGNTNWKIYSYTYSFESDYSQAKGEEFSCNYSSSGYQTIICGDAETLLTRYAKANGTYDQLIQKTSQSGEGYISDFMTYYQLLSESVKNGSFPSQIKMKREPVVLYNILSEDVLIGLLFTILFILLWFIFWESIVYRLIVYIILGKK